MLALCRNIAEATEFEHRKRLYENNHALLVALPNRKVMAVRIGAQTTVSNVLRTIVDQKPEFSIDSCYLAHPRTGDKLEDDRPLLSTYDITQVRLVSRDDGSGSTSPSVQSEVRLSQPPAAPAQSAPEQSGRSTTKPRRSFLALLGLKSSSKKSANGESKAMRLFGTQKDENSNKLRIGGFGSMPNLVVATAGEPGMSLSLYCTKEHVGSVTDDKDNSEGKDEEDF